MSLKKNLLYNFLLSFSQVAFPLISIPFISRVLDPAGIGKVSFVDSLSYYFIVVAEFGIATYGIREVSRKKDHPQALQKLVSELLSLHLLTSICSVLLYSVVVFVLYQKINDLRLVWFSLSFLLVNSFACEWYFWGTEQFRYITLRSLVTRILGLVSLFLLVRRPEDYLIYYAIISGTAILNLLWNLFSLVKEQPFRITWPSWKKHWSSIKVTYQISLVYSVVLMLDNVFLQLVSTATAVAFYTFAAKISRLSGAMVTDTLLVFYPRTVSLVHRREDEQVRQTIRTACRLILLSTIPMAVGLFLIAGLLTEVYFGNAFTPVAANLRLLCLYPLLKAYGLFLNKQLLMPHNQERLVLNGLVAGALVFIGLTLPLSYFFADKGTCLAVILSEMVVVVYNYYYVLKLHPGMPTWDHKTFLQAIAGSLLFIPVVYLVPVLGLQPLWALVVIIALCIAVYLAFLLVAKNDITLSLLRIVKPSKTPLR